MTDDELALKLRRMARELEAAIATRRLQEDEALTMPLSFADDLVALLNAATLALLGLDKQD